MGVGDRLAGYGLKAALVKPGDDLADVRVDGGSLAADELGELA